MLRMMKQKPLNFTSSGNYYIPLDQVGDTKVEKVCQVRLDLLDVRETYKALTKFHKQFIHPSNDWFH